MAGCRKHKVGMPMNSVELSLPAWTLVGVYKL
jgi:hypothetical protein